MDFKGLDKEELLDRTNNICEGFNSIFNKHIGIKKAPLAVLVSKLKEIEFVHRQKILKKLVKEFRMFQ